MDPVFERKSEVIDALKNGNASAEDQNAAAKMIEILDHEISCVAPFLAIHGFPGYTRTTKEDK